jgi:4-aminobutyrate aminotransferase
MSPKSRLTVPGPKAKEVLRRDQKVIAPCYSRPYPAVIEKGEGVRVWDVDGNRFLDFAAGIATVSTGHCHPEVVKAIQDQADRLIHMSGTDFYYPLQVELAEKLAEITPGRRNKQVFFGNSGTEANEAALKLARYATGREKAIAFYGSFHGRTYGSLSLTASKPVQKKGFGSLLSDVFHVPYGYCYRCDYNLSYPSCEVHCVKFIEDVLFKKILPPEEVAAIFVEPIQGEGGYVIPPPTYLQELKSLAEKYGILLVADEVQSGMGRTGKMFAIEHWGVKPDIVTAAKGIASGMPLGACIATSSLMSWEPGAHASTFGGNPVSCAAALKTIELLEGGLLQNAREMGDYMMQRLQEMVEEHSILGDLRGKGLMIGVEVVKDKETRIPDPDKRDEIVQEAFERGLLILGAGPTTIRFSPPLVLTKEEAKEGLRVFEEAVRRVEKE